MTYEYLCLFLSFILQLAVLHSEISSPLSTKFSSAETRLNVKSGTSNDVAVKQLHKALLLKFLENSLGTDKPRSRCSVF